MSNRVGQVSARRNPGHSPPALRLLRVTLGTSAAVRGATGVVPYRRPGVADQSGVASAAAWCVGAPVADFRAISSNLPDWYRRSSGLWAAGCRQLAPR